jgi:transposase
MKIPRSSYYYQLKKTSSFQEQKDQGLRERIERVRLDFPCCGYRTLRRHFLREGSRINEKRIRRVVRSLFYTAPAVGLKLIAKEHEEPTPTPTPKGFWSSLLGK